MAGAKYHLYRIPAAERERVGQLSGTHAGLLRIVTLFNTHRVTSITLSPCCDLNEVARIVAEAAANDFWNGE